MKWIKKRDIFVAIGFLVVAGLLYLIYDRTAKDQDAKAEIYYESQLVKTIVLKGGKEEQFTLPQNEHVVFHVYSDGSICFERSDCPDKVCIKSGKLHQVGQSAACLPNKFIVKIVPVKEYSEEDVDLTG